MALNVNAVALQSHKMLPFPSSSIRSHRVYMASTIHRHSVEVASVKKAFTPPREVHVQVTHSMPPEKIEIFDSLREWAAQNILVNLKPVEKCWQPTDFLPDPASEGFDEQVKELRERCKEIPDDYFVVLIGDMITEEALPTYQTMINTLDGVRDETGASLSPWAVWTRAWTAEENRHGDLLNKYLYLSGRVDMRQIEKTIQYLIGSGMTRDLKLLPKSVRATLKIRRTCRKKIHERITALSALLTALKKLETDQNCTQEQMKASEKLGKVLNEADIRLLVASMEQKNGAEVAEKSVKLEEKLLIKQLEREKREAEKEKKRMEREVQKEKLKSEKELKRLQSEAVKEEKRFEKEESKLKKQILKEQEETEKDRRRKEKEEVEVKKQLALQKQASMMERFLKRSKTNSSSQNGREEPASDFAPIKCEKMPKSVTLSMDSTLAQNDDFNADDLWKSHLSSWHCLGRSILSKGKVHWGICRKPKTNVVKEIKLTASRGLSCYVEDNTEKLVDRWAEPNSNTRSCNAGEVNAIPCRQKGLLRRQLLQFDKCHRPAFYGVWLKKSQVVGARHPFAMDPDLDYEVDSDEEWEEEEPGESLSDCDKDDNECLEEECSRGEDEDESEDGFLVPDGYLSAEEGVQVDKMESHDAEGSKILSSSAQEGLDEEFAVLLRQQKYLHYLTEQALRKNKPLVILNLMHEKAPLLLADELSGNEKVEQMCLGALAICTFPGHPSIPISTCNDVVEEDSEACPSGSKAITPPIAPSAALADSDLHQVVSVIQSCSHGINKVVESLQLKFPSMGKSQLKNKVREIAEFIDGRWQVRKDVLVKLGLPISPEKGIRTKSIATFFSKRCLPPSGKTINLHESSPQACQKTSSVSIQPQQDCTYNHE